MPSLDQAQSEIDNMVEERVIERKANYLNVNVAARHFDREATQRLGLNEVNPGIGLEQEDGDIHKMAGYYKNSFNRPSVYGLIGYTPLDVGGVKVGVVGGGATGYLMPVTPVAGLMGTYQHGDTGVNVTVVPNVSMGNSKAYGFAGIQLRHKIK